jgi:GNAT superfamily N-acetyltransferase
VLELAEYEKARHEVDTDEAALHAMLFGPDAVGRCEVVEVDGAVVGMALWYRSLSTWTGPGLYLEDLYVQPQHRGAGHGRALLARLAAICVERGWARFEWAVLDWNAPALGFYRTLGAVAQSDWIIHRVSGQALGDLADAGGGQ